MAKKTKTKASKTTKKAPAKKKAKPRAKKPAPAKRGRPPKVDPVPAVNPDSVFAVSKFKAVLDKVLSELVLVRSSLIEIVDIVTERVEADRPQRLAASAGKPVLSQDEIDELIADRETPASDYLVKPAPEASSELF